MDESFWHKDVFFRRAKFCFSFNWRTQRVETSKQELCDNISFAFFCNANIDTGKWRSFIINNQLNNSSSIEAGYDSGRPAPLAFPFHSFPPVKPWWLSLSHGVLPYKFYEQWNTEVEMLLLFLDNFHRPDKNALFLFFWTKSFSCGFWICRMILDLTVLFIISFIKLE